MMWVFPLAAAVVSGVFSARLGQQYITRRRPHQLAWALAMLTFAVASFAAAMGMLGGWTTTWFSIFFLFGAIVNVPLLALGTIYLLGPRALGHAAAVATLALAIFAAGAVFGAGLDLAALRVEGIPRAKDVYGGSDPVRALGIYSSTGGFLVVVLGALWSAWRLSRDPSPYLRGLASGNVLIAFGTIVVAAASYFLRWFEGDTGSTGFSIGLLIGVCLMFAGFVKARPLTLQDEPDTSSPEVIREGSAKPGPPANDL